MTDTQDGQQQNQEKNNDNSSKNESSSKDFFKLSKTCGENCSIIILVFLIMITIFFFIMLIYCKYYRKSSKRVQNIVVQVKAIQINQSVLEHIKSLSQMQIKQITQSPKNSQSLLHQRIDKESTQFGNNNDFEYKNYLNNQVLMNIQNGRQMFENESVQFVKDQNINFYNQRERQISQADSQLNYYFQNDKEKKIPISQQGERKDNQINPIRITKSEMTNYQCVNSGQDLCDSKLNKDIKDGRNIKFNHLAEQKQNSQKKSALVLDSQKYYYNKNQQSQDITQNSQIYISQKIQPEDYHQQSNKKHGKVKLASLYPLPNKSEIEVVKEENIDIIDTQTKNPQNRPVQSRVSIIQQQNMNDPQILDSSLNYTNNPDDSLTCNNSILKSLQFGCNNQNSKMLGEQKERNNNQDNSNDYDSINLKQTNQIIYSQKNNKNKDNL